MHPSKELSLCHKLKSLIPMLVQPDGENLRYFKLSLFDPKNVVLN